ncbi:MAG TPA: Lrp/AsnC family transcriptional regulator [Cytophagaceae bacterium]|jgi:Lrp/AsnC family leucine-responsive transcriptional regulator|nr:Lrp/AsnC family transcriptional regulator [Cytophagaceae bacterium]
MQTLDETDLEILRQLQENALTSTKELAGKLHLSITPVYERIKRMEREGYIKKYVALLNKDKLKKGLVVFCNVSLKQHTREIGKQFVQEIISLPEVVECYNISGEYDFLLKILVEDMPQYQEFVMNRLGSIENIGSAHSIFVMGEIKNSTKLPI